MSATVAAIIPTRDRPVQVSNAIRSALAQTYPGVEVWVTDDGSSPPLTLPPDLAGHPRVHLLRFPQSLGAGAARNHAVECSSATYLAFLDDDDEWSADSIARRIEVLEASGSSVAGVDCGFELVADGRCQLRSVPVGDRDLPRALLEGPCMAPSTVVLRRAAFEAVGGFRTDLERTEDWELWLRLADRYRMAALPEVLCTRHPSGTSAAYLLSCYQAMVQVMSPRIARLGPDDERRVRSGHLLTESLYLAAAAGRRPAWARLRLAWAVYPSTRVLVGAARVLIGERPWALAKATVARLPGRGQVLSRR